MTPVRLKPGASLSRVKHSTTEPLRSLFDILMIFLKEFFEKVNFEKKSADKKSLKIPVSTALQNMLIFEHLKEFSGRQNVMKKYLACEE